MLILHNAETLKHRTSEVVGSRLIDAHEDPRRLESILTALSTAPTPYSITTVATDHARAEVAAGKIHTPAYLSHLKNIFATWQAEGMVDEDGCILPECFPVHRFAPGGSCREPKDIYARVGFYAFDMSTGISRETWESAIASADLARRGAEELFTKTMAKRGRAMEHAELRNGGRVEEDEDEDEERVVFSLCRPPGHHCSSDLMGGYCYLNNTAIAVRTLLDLVENLETQESPAPVEDSESEPPSPTSGPVTNGHAYRNGISYTNGNYFPSSYPVNKNQITILDLDFHHGNGTQSIFYSQSNPCYVSIHGEDEYPYFTGSPEETGIGAGLGFNLNLPVPCPSAPSSPSSYAPGSAPAGGGLHHNHCSTFNRRPSVSLINGVSVPNGNSPPASPTKPPTTWTLYHPQLLTAVKKIREVDTKWLVVSMGFDTYKGDPIGKFSLERRDYGEIGEIVGGLGLPTLVVLEGGYVVEELGNNCVAFLAGLERGRARLARKKAAIVEEER